jgi:hypothetical protein
LRKLVFRGKIGVLKKNGRPDMQSKIQIDQTLA